MFFKILKEPGNFRDLGSSTTLLEKPPCNGRGVKFFAFKTKGQWIASWRGDAKFKMI
jgi:hypothetical protein